MTSNAHIVIVGGGAAGIAMANRFTDSLLGAKITMIGERQRHLYQPNQTLVALGLWDKSRVTTQTKNWLPNTVNWIEKDSVAFDPYPLLMVR